MGFFSALFGGSRGPATNVEVVADRIWLTTDAKFAGLAKEAARRSESDAVAMLLVAHFPDVLARLVEISDQHMSGVPVMAVLASDLSVAIATNLQLSDTATIDIIVGERHPLPSVDEHLEQFADELPCHCRLTHHLSLEDPVMATFGGEWVHTILEKLGMTEEESIESRMVSRRIKQAQQKIEGKVKGNLKADSAAQWLEKNCPEVGDT